MPLELLENRRKAARVLVALGPERSAGLLRTFDEEQVTELLREAADIGRLSAQEVVDTLTELAQAILARRSAAEGGYEFARTLLAQVMGEARAAEMAELIDPDKNRPFGYLATAEAEVAARAVTNEPPATIALALAHLDSRVGAKILRALPAEVRGETATRLANLRFVGASVVTEVDTDLRARVGSLLTEPVTEIAGVERLVEVLNNANRETEKEVIEAIEAQDADLAARVRDSLFVFEDIGMLDDRAIQQILKSVDSRDLATALKGAEEAEVSRKILANLSERARENLQEEIEFMKGVRPSDIREARTRLVREVRALEEAGTITIDRGSDDEEEEA